MQNAIYVAFTKGKGKKEHTPPRSRTLTRKREYKVTDALIKKKLPSLLKQIMSCIVGKLNHKRMVYIDG